MARTRPRRLPTWAAAMLAASAPSSSASCAASRSASAPAFSPPHPPPSSSSSPLLRRGRAPPHRGRLRGRHRRVLRVPPPPCDGGPGAAADGGRPRGFAVGAEDGRGATRGAVVDVVVDDADGVLESTTSTRDDDDDDDRDSTTAARYDAFVNDVVSFLDGDGASLRAVTRDELRRVLERHHLDDRRDGGGGRGRKKAGRGGVGSPIDETMALLERDVFLVIGDAAGPSGSATSAAGGGDGGAGRRHSFVLHLCPIPDLDTMLASYRGNLRRIRGDDDDDRDDDVCGGGGGGASATATSWAVSAHAWLNARLTDSFASPSCRRGNGGGDSDDDDGGGEVGHRPGRPPPPSSPTSIVHLHPDVWRRSRSIVESRLRGKCGMHRRRYYARRTVVRRVSESEYAPFLAEHHLWGATGAKFAYGLFAPTDGEAGGRGDLVAVATFSSGRTISRADRPYRSFELLRFCTAKDATVVGGLTKLMSAFVRDVAERRGEGDGSGMDIVTSIDRDFGRGDSWPNFASVEVMDPVPMFVGEVDGARRHAVGAGLTPLGQPRLRLRRRTTGDDEEDDDGSTATISSSGVLRAGLPESLLRELGEGQDDPWRTAARRGFHPVFDAGVERLISVVADGAGGGGGVEDEDKDDGRTKISPSPVELWAASTPRYAKEHYSSNAGVREMLQCIRSAREMGDS
jgi:hypothetical protein